MSKCIGYFEDESVGIYVLDVLFTCFDLVSLLLAPQKHES